MIYVSSDVIVGNFLLEFVKHSVSSKNKTVKIPVGKLIKFDDIVSENIKEDKMCTVFSSDKLMNFEETYPFFGMRISKDRTHLLMNTREKQTRLNRYFRIGIPIKLVSVFEKAFEEVYP